MRGAAKELLMQAYINGLLSRAATQRIYNAMRLHLA